ncbi:hypothetical protein AB4Z14_20035 [Terrabacter sp. 2TAF16]|jgi:hypothetical protein
MDASAVVEPFMNGMRLLATFPSSSVSVRVRRPGWETSPPSVV